MKIFHLVIYITFILFCTNACVVGFDNSQKRIPKDFASLYFPSAVDSSISGGNSSRLSSAIRQKLLQRSDINLTDIQHARWALQVKILDREQSIVAVDTCKNPTTPSVASGAFSCTAIHPKFSTTKDAKPYAFNKPSISPAKERLSLVVESKAIDLNSGQTIWAKRYFANNVPAIVFDEIGDTDGNTVKYMQQTPDLHSLRHQEVIENAVLAFSQTIAKDILNTLFKSFPDSFQKETH